MNALSNEPLRYAATVTAQFSAVTHYVLVVQEILFRLINLIQ